MNQRHLSKQEEVKFNINQRDKDVVNGYSKMIQQLLPKNNAYYNIITEIKNIIFAFYHLKLTFNQHHQGKNLQFINNKIVKKINKNGWSSCIFGEELRNTRCQKFEIKIKIKCSYPDIIIGFITSSIEQSIKDWDHYLGFGLNKDHSAGICIFYGNNHFYLYQNNSYKSLPYKAPQNFKKNDVFTFSFNMAANNLSISHNGKNTAQQISLKRFSQITPAFSLWGKGNKIEIMKTRFS